MFEDLNKILDDSLMKNSELLKEIKIENIKNDMLDYVIDLIVQEFNCNKDDAFLYWESFKERVGV